jgi:hypothetical protein
MTNGVIITQIKQANVEIRISIVSVTIEDSDVLSVSSDC